MNNKSTFKNIIFTYKYLLKDQSIPYYFIRSVLLSILNIFISFAQIFLPAFVIRMFQNGLQIYQIILGTLSYLFLLLLIDITTKRLERNLNNSINNIRMLRAKDYYSLSLNLDFEYIDTENYRIKFEKGINSYYDGYHMGFHHIIFDCQTLFTSIIGLIVFLIYSSDISIYLALVTFFTSLMTMLLYHKNSLWIKENEDERQKIDSKMNYIFRHSISLKHAKDIRFFSLPLMLKKEYENLNIQRKNWLAKESKKTFKIKFVDRTLSFIKVISLYYIIFKKSYIGVDRAIVLIGLMSGMSEWLKNIFDSIIFLDNNSINVSNTREMLNLKPKIFSNKSLDYKEFTTPTIEFKNVSYSFMETGVQIFKDFNLKILPGEKIAIVGDNGAGKTTLIKLLLGLYKPTKGKILFDGQDIQKISKEQLFKKLCAVFQDFNFFASSIAENISCSSKYNYEKLSIILDQVDLSNRISSLPNGIFTEMTKEISKDGILLSGGESQNYLWLDAFIKILLLLY